MCSEIFNGPIRTCSGAIQFRICQPCLHRAPTAWALGFFCDVLCCLCAGDFCPLNQGCELVSICHGLIMVNCTCAYFSDTSNREQWPCAQEAGCPVMGMTVRHACPRQTVWLSLRTALVVVGQQFFWNQDREEVVTQVLRKVGKNDRKPTMPRTSEDELGIVGLKNQKRFGKPACFKTAFAVCRDRIL